MQLVADTKEVDETGVKKNLIFIGFYYFILEGGKERHEFELFGELNMKIRSDRNVLPFISNQPTKLCKALRVLATSSCLDFPSTKATFFSPLQTGTFSDH